MWEFGELVGEFGDEFGARLREFGDLELEEEGAQAGLGEPG